VDKTVNNDDPVRCPCGETATWCEVNKCREKGDKPPYTGPERRRAPTVNPAASDPQPEHKPVHIPGAVWPDPRKTAFDLDAPDKYNRALRHK
jgi:hypothetical protein